MESDESDQGGQAASAAHTGEAGRIESGGAGRSDAWGLFRGSGHLSFFRASAAALPKPSETVGWLKTMSLMSSARAPELDRQGGEMDDLRGVLPGDVGADEPVRGRVEDELEEPGDVPVEAGADEVVVAALADDDVAAAGPGPFLGLADRADLGVGVDAPGRAGVIHPDVEAHGVLGRDRASTTAMDESMNRARTSPAA